VPNGSAEIYQKKFSETRMERFQQIARNSRLIIEKVKQGSNEIIERKNTKGTKDQIMGISESVNLLLVELKQLNRELQLEAENRKLETNKHKHRLDDINLKLQNLLYEKDHLEREIQSCRDFK
jgi:hypothetical protein